MGKASSNKKVARAAGTGGGRTAGARRPWTYYGVIALIVVLGVAGTAESRHERNVKLAGSASVAPTVGGTAWNEALGVYVCGQFLPNIRTSKDPSGITMANADGVIRIHPFNKSAAGHNATLGKFATSVGMKLSSTELQVPGGHLYKDGDSCEGQPGHIYVKQFAYAGDPTGNILSQDPSSVRLEDQQMLTVAFVPASKKASIPAPPVLVQDALKKAAASSSTSTATTLPATTATTSVGTATTKVSTATTKVSTATTKVGTATTKVSNATTATTNKP